ncbi:pentatricopeptide repeat-containing protein At1g01970-like [Phalaenopsis equestris]|uniref:pentatricopeptide repeat-containing protein At1g01970-like n=1 Tax=Phalaenopsis equestris TaxID=78828 RepID=UPI0009E5F340|nr:pentatricopeptide repeat-containing protein At1g01970-like [Phalaenopsis equestris]
MGCRAIQSGVVAAGLSSEYAINVPELLLPASALHVPFIVAGAVGFWLILGGSCEPLLHLQFNSIWKPRGSTYTHSRLDICKYRAILPQSCFRSPSSCLFHGKLITVEGAVNGDVTEGFKLKWREVGPDITEAQKHEISQLSLTLTNRCKALLRRIICFSQEEDLFVLLASWVKAMQPKRCDWLSVLKEIKRIDTSLYFEAIEYALHEESFEANARDYTKLIDAYAKHYRFSDAQSTFESMKVRGFPCDQVTLTVLINMYDKSGDLRRAEEAFQHIKLLESPIDKRSYGSMIMAYIRAGKPELAEALLKVMEAEQVVAGREVYKAVLRAYSMAGDDEGAQRVFDAIQFAGIVPDSRICALLVNAYCVAGKIKGARSSIENMRAAGLKPNDKCVAVMLRAYRKEKKMEEALDLLMELEGDGVVMESEASEVLAQWLRGLGVIHELGLALR